MIPVPLVTEAETVCQLSVFVSGSSGVCNEVGHASHTMECSKGSCSTVQEVSDECKSKCRHHNRQVPDRQ